MPALSISAPAPARPNIIFIFCDDLGYGDLGCFGQTKIQTPNLDKMAKEGLRFTQFYAGSTVCAPSRATLLTGLHTGHNTIRGNGNPPLPAQPDSLGKLMQSAGYHTGIIGKWGMGPLDSSGAPLKQGFDEFRGFLGHTAAHEQYPEVLHKDNAQWDIPKGTYANDLFSTEALDFVRRNQKSPFFLYLPFTTPHQKMAVPDLGAYASKDWPEVEKIKAAMITRMDGYVGQLMAELKSLGLDEKTMVMFTSDNGPHHEGGVDVEFFDSNGPFRGLKRDLYEGGIREPTIVRWPGVVKPGDSDQVWALWDLLPTLVDIAGGTVPKDRDGVSMKQVLLTGQSVPRDPLYWEFYEGGFSQAVRKDDWKLVKTTTGSLELYDLKTDEGETRNLAETRPGVLMELMPLLSSMRTNDPFWDLTELTEKVAQKKATKMKRNQKDKNPAKAKKKKP